MPPAAGLQRASQAKVSASSIAPPAVNSQPSKLTPPKALIAAGSRKMPEPIMLPTTKAVAIAGENGALEDS